MALCLVLPWIGVSQTIHGKVTDADDGTPLAGAHIQLTGTFKGVFTNSDGVYRIENLPAGTYTLMASFLGYEKIEKKAELITSLRIDFSLIRKATLTDEIVVRATRAGQNTPATYTNLSRSELAAGNLGVDMPYLLSLTPSVITSSDAGAGVGYTWMNIRGSDNTRINVTINGIPINDAESHGVWWVNMPDIATSTDNLQIQRGVGLSTHGSGAFGGTISLQTTTLRDEPYAELNSSYGSFNTRKNSLAFGSGLIGGHWAFDGRLSKISSDGYIDRAWSDLKSYYLSGAYYGQKTVVKAITFSGTEKTYQAWNGVPGDSLRSNRRFNPSGMYYDAGGNLQYYDNETDNYQQDHFQIHFSHYFVPDLTANLSGHYTYGRGYYEQYRPNDRFSRYDLPDIIIGETTISRSDMIRRRWLDNHFYGITWSLHYAGTKNLNTTFGGGYNIYKGDHYGEIIWAKYAANMKIRHRYYENDAVKKDFNAFLKMDYELNDGLHLFSDLQYRKVYYNFLGLAWVNEMISDLQQDVEYHFFNPKAGLNYTINAANRVYMYAGIGNREPVRRDFTESSPESRPRPERMYNIESGYTHSSQHLRFGANLFLMYYKDQLILTGEINDVGGFTRTNIDKSYRAGIELESAAIISSSLKWQGNLTLSRNIIPLFTEFVDKYDNNFNWIGYEAIKYRQTTIAFSPSVVAASHFNYHLNEKMSVNIASKYVGRQYIDNTTHIDRMLKAYLIHNLGINYSIHPLLFKEMLLSLQVNNLTNRKYSSNAWVYKGVVGDQGLVTIKDGWFPQAGIHFLAGISLKF